MALTFLKRAKQLFNLNSHTKLVKQVNRNTKPFIFMKNINLIIPNTTNKPSQCFCDPNLENYFCALKKVQSKNSFLGSRKFHTSANNSLSSKPPLPRILYIQNPFTWMVNKFDMKILEKAWDPSFNQLEFLRGSRQAVSKVTILISERKFIDLQGLLTKAARLSVEDDLKQPGADQYIKYLGLETHNILVASPRKLRFLKYEDRKFCDVDMMFIALKWLSRQQIDGLIYMEIFASFRREYTQYSIPEWTIAYFKFLKFNLMDR